jgi:hypothetical protein
MGVKMQRRLVNNGLGANTKVLLDNKGEINKEFADAALAEYFAKEKGYDFQITEDSITIGIEPTYMFDKLKLISINKDKSKSYIKKGIAFGAYGSQILGKPKAYSQYKRKCKFTLFVDKWHKVLYG